MKKLITLSMIVMRRPMELIYGFRVISIKAIR